jgi:purine nucleosidase
MMPSAHAAPTYFDCDTGIDDALALLVLARQSNLRVEGIGTVSGNVSALQAARNTLDLLPVIDLVAPVAVGAMDHLTRPFSRRNSVVHGPTGTGRVELPNSPVQPIAQDAADLLIELAHRHPGELRVIAVGPLTNLASALQRDPLLSSLVRDVTIMGGAALVPGNVTPAAEANIYNDPEAAAVVFAAPWPITMVGLDVTMQHRLEEHDRQLMLRSQVPGSATVAEMLDHYSDFYLGIFGRKSCALHDPLTVAVAAGLIDVADAPQVGIEIDVTDGPDRGRTVCDLRGRFVGYRDSKECSARVVLALTEHFAPTLLRLVN